MLNSYIVEHSININLLSCCFGLAYSIQRGMIGLNVFMNMFWLLIMQMFTIV